MLNERRAKSLYYDATTDVGRVAVRDAPGTIRTRTVAATLLLDAAGFLVGIDVEPDAPDASMRTVVMLGSHENVARAVATRVGVSTDHSQDVFEVRIAGARVAMRANEKNPYL